MTRGYLLSIAKPILFNTPMTQAILENRKNTTRRINKDGGPYSVPDMSFFDEGRRTYAVHNYEDLEHIQLVSLCEVPVPLCAGDILYVRETWRPAEPKCDGGAEYFYFADRFSDASDKPETGRRKWHPSIHMPKEAARIFLRVTGVRVERLQDCGNAQAKDEGCTCCSQFARIWDSTVKPADLPCYGWDANPWVWVIEFERVKPEEA